MDKKLKYRFDCVLAKTRRTIKRKLPLHLQLMIDQRKQSKSAIFVGHFSSEMQPPWSSPNVWNEIVNYYQRIEQPVIFEYGTGASSIWHFKNLLEINGTYIGVEIDKDWFWGVVSSLVKIASLTTESIEIQSNIRDDSVNGEVVISTNQGKAVLKLRMDWRSYVEALDQDCDVLVVDGAIRKQCIEHILSTKYLRNPGMLMLMEAGRGAPDWWQGKLYGDEDYTPQVNRLIELGGSFIDGNGVDQWPGCSRRSPKPTSYYYPKEAIKVVFR
jgi:hypothetical protein